jgi:uncharacterized protein YggE
MTEVVTVQGQAVVSAEPDEAHLEIGINTVARSPQAALTLAAGRSEQLEVLFRELKIPRKARSTSGVLVQERREYVKGKYVNRGYEASNNVTLRLKDPSLIGRLMHEATKRAHASVRGPWWRIARDNPARLEACRQAAADARRRAEAYVEALGGRLGAISQVTEPDVSVRRRSQVGMDMDVMADMAREPQLTVQAGDLDVWATVEVSFQIKQRAGRTSVRARSGSSAGSSTRN